MTASAVLFDIDGTLVDSNFLHVEAWSHAFQKLGLAVPSWRVQQAIGADSAELLELLIGDESDATKDRAGELNSDYYRALQSRIEVFDGARELVADLAGRGLRVVLATSAPKEELRALLEELDVDDHLYATTSAEDVEKAKPEPEIISLALAKGKVTAYHAVMIGDSVWDIKAATRAGVASIGLLSGGTSAEALLGEGAIAVFDDVAVLAQHLDDAAVARFFTV